MHVFRFREFGFKTLIHAPKLGVFRGKIVEAGRYWPQRTCSYFWGFRRLCPISWKSTKKCDRESVHRRTHTHTHTHTYAQTQNDFIICPMLYAIAMGQINDQSKHNFRHVYEVQSQFTRRRRSSRLSILNFTSRSLYVIGYVYNYLENVLWIDAVQTQYYFLIKATDCGDHHAEDRNCVSRWHSI